MIEKFWALLRRIENRLTEEFLGPFPALEVLPVEFIDNSVEEEQETARVEEEILAGLAAGMSVADVEKTLRMGGASEVAVRQVRERWKNALLQRASKCRCLALVRRFLESGDFKKALAFVAECEDLLERAGKAGVGPTVSWEIQRGLLVHARETVADAEGRQSLRREIEQLRKKSASLPESLRGQAELLLAQLAGALPHSAEHTAIRLALDRIFREGG